jgi:hypothetical protein
VEYLLKRDKANIRLGVKMKYKYKPIFVEAKKFTGTANRILKEFFDKMPIVYCTNNGAYCGYQCKVDTHKARLLGPVPIEKDSYEGLLKDWLRDIELQIVGNALEKKYVERAKRLLAGSGA